MAKAKVSKSGPVWHQSSVEATLLKKPRYNGFACGAGSHGDSKYCRTKAKRQFRKGLDSGLFSFVGASSADVAEFSVL